MPLPEEAQEASKVRIERGPLVAPRGFCLRNHPQLVCDLLILGNTFLGELRVEKMSFHIGRPRPVWWALTEAPTTT